MRVPARRLTNIAAQTEDALSSAITGARAFRAASLRSRIGMAPVDRFYLPFRWEFVPVRYPRDGSIRWKWRAYAQSGDVAMTSERTFDSLTECMNDARRQGYAQRPAGR